MESIEFRLPRSSYQEISKIIVGYSHCKEPAPLDELSKVTGVGRTVVSGNNAFLMSLGLIEGGKLKSPTELGRTLGRTLEHTQPDDTAAAWRSVVSGSDFLSKMVLAVRIRRGMDVESLAAHISYSAGESKLPSVLAGARAIVDILLLSGYIVMDREGRLVVPDASAETKKNDASKDASTKPSSDFFDALFRPARQVSTSPSVRSDPSVHIQVRIEAKPDELEGLSAKLRKFLDDMKSGQDAQNPTDEK